MIATHLLQAIERLRMHENVWLYDERIRVRRFDRERYVVIEHDPVEKGGRGYPGQHLPVNTPGEALEIVMGIAEKLETRLLRAS